MGRQVIAEVSQSALRHNLHQIRHITQGAKILAMVKANAYGHGLVAVAKTLSEADALGVASMQEALQLRQAGIKTPIVLMEGFFDPQELALIEQEDLIVVVHHWLQIQALRNYSAPIKQPFKVWLKINTGMNRLGFPLEECHKAHVSLTQDFRVEIIGYMTHFACADRRGDPYTHQQCQKFFAAVKNYPGQKSLANSASILTGSSEIHADWVRPGLILYGASPFGGSVGSEWNLKPAMTLRSKLIAIQELPPNSRVGYGGLWENKGRASKIGIVAIGYGDGYPWHAKNGTPVLVNGNRVGTVGRVSMDMLAVDLSELKQVNVGDPVILWGKDLPIEEVAQHADTIPYELFCRFTERVTIQVIP